MIRSFSPKASLYAMCHDRTPIGCGPMIHPLLRGAATLLGPALLILFLITPCALADLEVPDSGGDTAIDQAQEKVSTVLLNSAQWLDSFFRSDTYEDESNATRLKIKLDTFSEQDEDVEFDVRFDLRISLPATENRLNLILGNNPDDDPDADTPREELSESDDDVKAALEYFFFDSDRQNLKLTGGVRWRDSNVVGFVGPRHRILWGLDGWDLRMENRVRWFTDDGWDYRLRFDFERPVGQTLFFRLRPELNWYESEDGLYYNARAFLFHPLSKNRALEYQINNYFETEPSHQLKESNVKVRYRQRIWREWLTLEIAPQVAWYEEDDYDTTLGILVRLEGWFGRWNE
ncbi:MAG: hypothetical protein WBG37_08015 [Desulfobacterales bacterium]